MNDLQSLGSNFYGKFQLIANIQISKRYFIMYKSSGSESEAVSIHFQ